MLYQSLSRTSKSYHGVRFNPGEIHDVPGYINDKDFIRVKKDKIVETKKQGKAPVKVESEIGGKSSGQHTD